MKRHSHKDKFSPPLTENPARDRKIEPCTFISNFRVLVMLKFSLARTASASRASCEVSFSQSQITRQISPKNRSSWASPGCPITSALASAPMPNERIAATGDSFSRQRNWATHTTFSSATASATRRSSPLYAPSCTSTSHPCDAKTLRVSSEGFFLFTLFLDLNVCFVFRGPRHAVSLRISIIPTPISRIIPNIHSHRR